MRSIKFRVWHLIENRWATESEIENIILVNTFYHGGRFQLDERFKHGLANDLGTTVTVMQYTGLKDKNGKEIYEGDVVKHDYDSEPQTVVWVEDFITYKLMPSNIFPIAVDARGKKMEIIGNIHEHPHLLKEETV